MWQGISGWRETVRKTAQLDAEAHRGRTQSADVSKHQRACQLARDNRERMAAIRCGANRLPDPDEVRVSALPGPTAQSSAFCMESRIMPALKTSG